MSIAPQTRAVSRLGPSGSLCVAGPCLGIASEGDSSARFGPRAVTIFDSSALRGRRLRGGGVAYFFGGGGDSAGEFWPKGRASRRRRSIDPA